MLFAVNEYLKINKRKSCYCMAMKQTFKYLIYETKKKKCANRRKFKIFYLIRQLPNLKLSSSK